MRGSGAEGSHKNNLALISRAHVARTLVSAVSTFVSRRLGLGFAANASIRVFERRCERVETSLDAADTSVRATISWEPKL